MLMAMKLAGLYLPAERKVSGARTRRTRGSRGGDSERVLFRRNYSVYQHLLIKCHMQHNVDMKKAGIREARQNLSALLEEVRKGYEITITVVAGPFARLVPPLSPGVKPFPGR